MRDRLERVLSDSFDEGLVVISRAERLRLLGALTREVRAIVAEVTAGIESEFAGHYPGSGEEWTQREAVRRP